MRYTIIAFLSVVLMLVIYDDLSQTEMKLANSRGEAFWRGKYEELAAEPERQENLRTIARRELRNKALIKNQETR